jgi:two-component system, cell cycle response regulator DivK
MKIIKKIDKKIPIIAVTAFALMHEEENIMAEGFDDYLVKPITKNKLKEIIARVCPNQQSSEANDA